MWSKSIFRGLSFYGINLRIMQTELKMAVGIEDEVSFELSFDENQYVCTCIIVSFGRPGFNLSFNMVM